MPDWIPGFESPELLLLGIPLWLIYRRYSYSPGVTGGLRIAILALLLLCLAGPYWKVGGQGLDVVLILDRSRSMPVESEERLLELIANAETARANGDRLAIVTFGSRSQIEQTLSANIETTAFAKEILPDGSDLNDAILTGLSLLDANRPARMLVLSDGEANGAEPDSGARRARELGVPIDFRSFERMRVGDVAITDIQLPDTLAPREQFQFTVLVDSDLETSGNLTLKREGQVLSVQQLRLRAGINSVRFRDQIEDPGFYRFTVDLEVAGDPVEENNRGEGGVRVLGAPRILVLNTDGVEGNLVRALRAGELTVDVAVAATHPVTQDSLDPYRAVIIENVPAGDFGRVKMDRLAQYVEDLGGGLMMTGGQRSFGVGGYFQSPIDPILPVSMELRDENRKNRLAMVVALDRSGSMRAPVAGNLTKMDLANRGTVECVKLLARGDSIAILAVDTQAEIIQSLTDVEQKDVLVSAAESISVGGGGIFVYEALEAAYEQLKLADQQTRHVILFSDARDSERPGDFRGLLEEMVDEGITVSVIGLGTPDDPDAALLQEIAQLGQGNILFTADPQELPRLFSADTMSVAQSSFIEYDPETQPNGIQGELLPDARMMGEFEPGAFPAIYGYNLCYTRGGATEAVVSVDEYGAPWSAFWYRGLGRVSALTMEVDGDFQGPFGEWSDYADFLVTHGRWLLGTDAAEPVYISARREGLDAIVTVELDADRTEAEWETPELRIVPPGREREDSLRPDFIWVDADQLQARFRMDRNGTFRTLLRLGDRESQQGPAISLPYSPEFFPRRDLPTGFEQLSEISEISGGHSRTDVGSIFSEPPRTALRAALLPWLLGAALILVVAEIAGRRLDLWNRKPLEESSVVGNEETNDQKAGWIPQMRSRWLRKRRLKAARKAVERIEQPDDNQGEEGNRKADRVFDQAKRRARRRLSDE